MPFISFGTFIRMYTNNRSTPNLPVFLMHLLCLGKANPWPVFILTSPLTVCFRLTKLSNAITYSLFNLLNL